MSCFGLMRDLASPCSSSSNRMGHLPKTDYRRSFLFRTEYPSGRGFDSCQGSVSKTVDTSFPASKTSMHTKYVFGLSISRVNVETLSYRSERNDPSLLAREQAIWKQRNQRRAVPLPEGSRKQILSTWHQISDKAVWLRYQSNWADNEVGSLLLDRIRI